MKKLNKVIYQTKEAATKTFRNLLSIKQHNKRANHIRYNNSKHANNISSNQLGSKKWMEQGGVCWRHTHY